MVTNSIDEPRPLVIGPRVRAELERRVRELAGRFHPSPHDMRELAQLKDFLRITPIEAQ
jgi:hypothetical protein